ncbi:MAG: hypothetical protein [Caudoviricetes sp.]|nr:MAG: hypothetical protein [Caudoviricetes sp.]
MADIKFSEFLKATTSKDSDEIAILQDGVNKMMPSPVLESKIINKTVSRVIEQGGASLNLINPIGTVPTYADLALITPTPSINDAYQVEADGLVYVYTENGFQAEGDGFKVQPNVDGLVEEGNEQAVSGGEVYKKINPIDKTLNNVIVRKNYFNQSDIINGRLVGVGGSIPAGVARIQYIAGWDSVMIEVTKGFWTITTDGTFNSNPRYAGLFINKTDTDGVRLTSPTFEVTTDIAYLVINTKSPTVTLDLTKIQVEKGKVATPVVPYEDVVIDPEKVAEGVFVYKNLFDKNKVVQGEMVNAVTTPTVGVKVITFANWARGPYIKVTGGESGKNYVISGITINSNQMFAGLFNNDVTDDEVGTRITTNNFFVGPGETKYLAFSVKSPTFTADVNIIQVEEGLEATEYASANEWFIDGNRVLSSNNSGNEPVKGFQVTIQDNNVLIRNSYSDTHDLIQNYQYNLAPSTNGNFSAYATYLVPKDVNTSSDLTAYLMHNTNDSISPIQTSPYWYICGQHGYLIPRATIASHTFVIGEQVKDNANRQYEVIHTTSNQVYLSPKITVAGNTITRSWSTGQVLTSLSLLDGTKAFAVTATLEYQIKPMLHKKTQKIFVDGVEITDKGVYTGEVVKLVDVFTCVNPIGATFTGITAMNGTDLIEVTQSYFLKGKSSYSSTNLNMVDWVPFVKYHGFQPKGLRVLGDYKPYAIFPKTKPASGVPGRTDVDWNFPTDISLDSSTQYAKYLFTVNTTDLVDVTDIPDRTIQFHKTDIGLYGLGMASGLDLETGLTSKANRPLYNSEAFQFNQGSGTGSKTYFRAMTGDKFVNNVLPSSFVGQFNSYMAYFQAKENVQSYVVHTEDVSYIYIHTQVASDKIEISTDNIDGKALEIVESKDIELLTERVVNGKLYVKSLSNLSNYIVLKTIK